MIFPRSSDQRQVLSSQELQDTNILSEFHGTTASLGKNTIFGYIKSLPIGNPLDDGSYEVYEQQLWIKDLSSDRQNTFSIGAVEEVYGKYNGSDLRLPFLTQGQESFIVARYSQYDGETCIYFTNLKSFVTKKLKCLKYVDGFHRIMSQFIDGRYFIAASGHEYRQEAENKENIRSKFNDISHFIIINEQGHIESEKKFESKWGTDTSFDLFTDFNTFLQAYWWNDQYYFFHIRNNSGPLKVSTFDSKLNYLGTKILGYDYLIKHDARIYPLDFEFNSAAYVTILSLSGSPPNGLWSHSLMRVSLDSLEYEYEYFDTSTMNFDFKFNYHISRSSNELVVATQNFSGVFGEDLKFREAVHLRYDSAPTMLIKGFKNPMAIWESQTGISAGLVFICGQ